MVKRTLALGALTLGIAIFALDAAPVTWDMNQPAVQVQAGKRYGKKTGPQDGTGPIHEPGSGGGSGAGQGKGKMTGPRDGTGPIHTPGTGGGTGAGNRRGR